MKMPSTHLWMIVASSSARPVPLSSADAAAWASIASTLNATWLSRVWSSRPIISSGFRCTSLSTPNVATVPWWCSVSQVYSPARSKMMTWSVGCDSKVPSISFLTKKDLPEPVRPETKPTGEESLALLPNTRLLLSLFW